MNLKMKMNALYFLAAMIVLMPLGLADQVFLTNEDRLTGSIVNTDAKTYQLQTPGMGVINIPKSLVDHVITDADIKKAEAEAAAKKAKKWSGELETGFNRERGNVNNTELKGAFKLKRKTDKNEFDLQGDTYYSEEDRKMNSQKHHGMIRYAYSFGQTKKWFHFFKTEGDHDRFANIDARVIPTTGLGYWFSDSDDFKFMTEIGAGLTYTAFHDDTKERTDLTVTPHLFIEKKLFWNSSVSEDLFLYPTLSGGEFRFKSETKFDNPITDQLKLRFSLINHYNSDPGEEVKKNDLSLVSSLVYTY
ncbi:MAG: hypothetical protein COV74_04270 [Candidatus Omnitrophica bacterium CG11_big_fil_rev_8_21_14_0_20_45_26]|uniref:DUF481 domain-containing protein n=1 Tax=Candidatus Abzuiibacterium crystallinum TaxID=1974748 RepID=A0A2H0LQ88_9BACT|nr:MAG: hypothetical protein COV74_04270 [Candidatus Omnitrophica bacterium CG11_big_fil_rev_8_21_14_0_20_45_26]PIW63973.1 MAG: hypothetical protein COW12_08710 [Candidatus Omnitrophica bacterium CG12_big_fil_rev_8_21_14_0_65_45_16]